MNLKRILLILLFILLCAAIGFGIWWFLFRPIFAPPVAEVPPAVPAAPPTGLPPALPAPPRAEILPTVPAPAPALPTETAIGGLTKINSLTASPILKPFLAPDGSSVRYYSPADGKFYQITADGQVKAISDKTFYNVSNVTWSPKRERAILEYPDQSKLLYNFANQTQVSLPKHWQEFSFSPSGEKIAFLSMGLDVDNRWLAIANANGSTTQAIEPVGENANKVQIAWSPNNQIIAFSRTGEAMGLDTQEILFVGTKHENFKSLTANGLGFEAKWAPDGEKILYSATNGSDDWKPRLWLAAANVDTIGQNKTPLNIYTWVDKCAFADSSTVYCAAPKELPRGAGLYSKAADEIADDIYKINLETGGVGLIAIPAENYTAENLLVSDDEKYLFFTDKSTGQLYKINLK